MPQQVSTEKPAIEHFLDRARENVYPTPEALGKELASGRRLTVYLGVDPSGPSLHIGHAIAMRKLAELQKMGHRCILLIGDFTAMIGDPTDKSATRVKLSREQVLENCKSYKEQASKILDFGGENPVELKFNNDWLGKMSFSDVVELASHFTVQQMAERDMFRRRMSWRSDCPFCGNENYMPSESQETSVDDKGNHILVSTYDDNRKWKCKKCRKEYAPETAGEVHSPRPVYLHEFLYPLMQGYDSVAMDVDLEIGGNDQTFNMLAGRTLLREMKGKEKYVLTCKLLTDPTGKKMGKSEGNMITLNDAPEDMYGKVMSWTDGMIVPGFELCTDLSDAEIKEIQSSMEEGENPMTHKRRLAKEIVRSFISDDAAAKAEEHFTTVHQKHEMPEQIPEFKLKNPNSKLVDVLVESGLVASKTEARRQIEQGAVKVDDQVATDVNGEVTAGSVIQKGKRFFVKLV
ncbi:MAG: tyrosine--tRNA ligase [Patescibacteria group bacterium]|nr:tyrosine--tRNA ligase [Patescibacteria group bacterium]